MERSHGELWGSHSTPSSLPIPQTRGRKTSLPPRDWRWSPVSLGPRGQRTMTQPRPPARVRPEPAEPAASAGADGCVRPHARTAGRRAPGAERSGGVQRLPEKKVGMIGNFHCQRHGDIVSTEEDEMRDPFFRRGRGSRCVVRAGLELAVVGAGITGVHHRVQRAEINKPPLSSEFMAE